MYLLTAQKVTNSVYADATDVLKTNFKLTSQRFTVLNIDTQLWNVGCYDEQKGAVCSHFLSTLGFTNKNNAFWGYALKMNQLHFLNSDLKHTDTIGPPYMHHFFMSAGHGILNF